MTVVIANGAGFLGDRIDVPRRLVDAVELDFLTLEYLAELTMSILGRVRQQDPRAGYAADFVRVLGDLVEPLAAQGRLHVVTNAGGTNPRACVLAAARVLSGAGLGDVRLGLVAGDDLLPALAGLQQAGCRFENLETGRPLSDCTAPPIAAHVYMGARGIVRALGEGARLVVTGRVADASLTVGPAVHCSGWAWDDWDRLAGATVAGHLIECGAQVTGGYATDWGASDLADVGYPIAELAEDGGAVITKPAGTGGRVDRQTVAEQLVYEIDDPRAYRTPDVLADFTRVELDELGADRVRVWGARGSPAPQQYKALFCFQDGYTASGQLLVFGNDCVAKARACAQIVCARLAARGVTFARMEVELLGAGGGVRLPETGGPPACRELVLRMAAHDADRAKVAELPREMTALVTSGPAGLAGYAAGRAAVRPAFLHWPALVPRDLVTEIVQVRTAAQWLAEGDDDERATE